MVTGAGTARCCCCAGFGGGSTPGRKLPRWSPPRSFRCFCNPRTGRNGIATTRGSSPILMLDDRRHHDDRLAGRHTAHAARTDAKNCVAFYRRVRPAGPGWQPIAAAAGDVDAARAKASAMQFDNWILGCVLIYTTLFGIGKLIFKEWTAGLAYIAAARRRRRADFAESVAGRLERIDAEATESHCVAIGLARCSNSQAL